MNKIQKILLCAAMSAAAAVTGCKDDGGDHTTNTGGGDPYFENYEHVESPITDINLMEANVELLHKSFRTSQYNDEIRLLKSFEELTSYMEINGCGGEKDIACLETMREIVNRTDFKKYTYFADGGRTLPRTDWKIISETESAVTINYIAWRPPKCDPPRDIAMKAPSFSVYFIPFTEKQLNFTETVEYMRCN
jgi:hypothetical protein